MRRIEAYQIGDGFIDYCIRRGWVMMQGSGPGATYYITPEGAEALKKFGIMI